MKRVFRLILAAVVGLLFTGESLAVSEISEANFTIYAALIFAIIVSGMMLVHLSMELRNHTEILRQIERIEEHHHNEGKIGKKKSSRASEVEGHQKARRLKEIKKLVREIKRI